MDSTDRRADRQRQGSRSVCRLSFFAQDATWRLGRAGVRNDSAELSGAQRTTKYPVRHDSI